MPACSPGLKVRHLLAPLQPPPPYPATGSQQWSSQSPLMLEKQLPHVSVKTVQYQGHRCAYGLEELNFPLQGSVKPPACSDRYTGLDNETSLPLQPIGRPEGVLPGLSSLILLHRIRSHPPSSSGSLEPLQRDQNRAPMLWPGLRH